MNTYWQKGEMVLLASHVGIAQSTLSAILHRRRRVSPDMALRLEMAAGDIGKDISAMVWIYAYKVEHPAFFGERKGK